MSIQKYAVLWSKLQAEYNHLVNLLEGGKLNAEQTDYTQGYIHHLDEEVEQLECIIFEMDEEGVFYQDVRELADTLTVTPSEEFLTHLNKQLSGMKLDAQEFQIKKAVDQYNSFYYSCAIYVTDKGHVCFNGCGMESSKGTTVLFNKKDKKSVTIADVKRKLIAG